MAGITRDTLIREVLVSYPDAADVFERHGLACASCLASGMETVSAVAAMHDVSVDALLAELNELPDQPHQRSDAMPESVAGTVNVANDVLADLAGYASLGELRYRRHGESLSA